MTRQAEQLAPRVKLRAMPADPQYRGRMVAVALAPTLVPAIADAIAAELAAAQAEQQLLDGREEAVLEACKAVGSALDRLEQAKFTSGEPGARVSLEKAARQLRALMKTWGRG